MLLISPLAVTGGAVTGRDLSGAISVSQLMFHKAPSCPADFNQDGFLDFFDYDGFVGAFESGGPGADFNQDGFLDFFDYDGFVQAFEVGC